jgi:hypothetical protein
VPWPQKRSLDLFFLSAADITGVATMYPNRFGSGQDLGGSVIWYPLFFFLCISRSSGAQHLAVLIHGLDDSRTFCKFVPGMPPNVVAVVLQSLFVPADFFLLHCLGLQFFYFVFGHRRNFGRVSGKFENEAFAHIPSLVAHPQLCILE